MLDAPRLFVPASVAVDSVTESGGLIYVPSICLVEATYLVEKKRIPREALAAFDRVLGDLNSPLRLFELNHAVAQAVREVSRAEVSDLPGRVIAATAVALQFPLITRDSNIRAPGVETIW